MTNKIVNFIIHHSDTCFNDRCDSNRSFDGVIGPISGIATDHFFVKNSGQGTQQNSCLQLRPVE